MANIKIAQLTNQINIADTDLILIESATSTNKMTVGKFKELLGINQGGIVESGSNTNGAWIKYADGTMICRQRASTDATSIQNGSLYRSSNTTWSFPQTFIEAPSLSIQVDAGTAYGWGGLGSAGVNSTQASFVAYSATSSTYGAAVSLIAIGRWK